jgi:voltage-gated potassium channel
MKSLRNLRLIGVALLGLTLAGTAGFHFIEGWSWFDGFYMVITTFTTIGYQETHPLSHAGRVFNVGLIVVGVSLVFLGIGSLTQALLEFELGSFFGRRKMEREIGRLSDHYIICGAGRVGRSAARELASKGVPFIIVDQSADRAAGAGDAWLTLVGDATQGQTLRDAHIERARGLVAATTTDATNLYIVLTGQRIARSFLQPHVVSFLDSATTHLEMDLEIGEICVADASTVAGKTIETSRIRQDCGAVILAIKREKKMDFNPSPEDRIEPGDYLIAMGESSQLRQLERMATARS